MPLLNPAKETRTLVSASGNAYTGTVISGGNSGLGVFHCEAEQVTFSGEWKDHTMDGVGVFEAHGDTYSGQVREGEQEGLGAAEYPIGIKYFGYFREGRAEGSGVREYANGMKYSGEWRGGKKEDFGVYQFSDGNAYYGEWSGGKRHGQAVFELATGTKTFERWDRDKRVAAVVFDESNTEHVGILKAAQEARVRPRAPFGSRSYVFVAPYDVDVPRPPARSDRAAAGLADCPLRLQAWCAQATAVAARVAADLAKVRAAPEGRPCSIISPLRTTQTRRARQRVLNK